MATVIKLGMMFDSETAPDFGDIDFDKNGNLILTNGSLVKLITNVTHDVCGDAFNISIGTKALVADTGAIFIYHANDRWYLREGKKFDPEQEEVIPIDADGWYNPEKHHAGFFQIKLQSGRKNYLLTGGQKIVFSVLNGNTALVSKEMTYDNYMGSGYYVVFINDIEADTLRPYIETKSYTMSMTVLDDATDITNTLTISNYEIILKKGCDCNGK